jgi:hypothetical protein
MENKMTKLEKEKMIESAVVYMKQLAELSDRDQEGCHWQADRILCDVLTNLGYTELVEAFNDVEKWYA